MQHVRACVCMYEYMCVYECVYVCEGVDSLYGFLSLPFSQTWFMISLLEQAFRCDVLPCNSQKGPLAESLIKENK